MFKNVASQKIQLFAFTTTDGVPKTGDAANITAYVSKDHGAVTVLTDTSATEMDATNAKGVYVFDVAQAETNADELTFSAKSSTSNISIVPRFISTNPPSFTAFVTPTGAAVNATQIGGQTASASGTVTFPNATLASTTNISAGTIATVSGNVNGNVGGNVTGSVGSVATGGIAAASFAAGAIDATAIASNAITAAKIASDAITDAKVAADVTIASVTGAVGSVTGLTASDVGAIKAKTDSLTFTVAGNADVNIQYVNDTQIQGTGAVGSDEWRKV